MPNDPAFPSIPTRYDFKISCLAPLRSQRPRSLCLSGLLTTAGPSALHTVLVTAKTIGSYQPFAQVRRGRRREKHMFLA